MLYCLDIPSLSNILVGSLEGNQCTMVDKSTRGIHYSHDIENRDHMVMGYMDHGIHLVLVELELIRRGSGKFKKSNGICSSRESYLVGDNI